MSNKQSSDLNKLRAAVTDMDNLSQTAFKQIAAISTLLLYWLKTPQGQVNTDITVEALNCITYLAQSTCENIGYEADGVGCAYDDDSKKGGE
ncbi:hypothetical protein [Citrobacter koseri]|uniref:hypothetical protein n=1 Tax=Citrobacter koseri TaxID=545 RepID=UPI00254B7903|nr:hypothetical protein [Citrobacter koseri]MEC5640740.1 hypothetical protein [Citrobacter koseri]